MNKKIYDVENIFKADIGSIADGGEAWRIGDIIFRAAYERTYLNADKNTLITFLENASMMQNEKGFVALYVDETMPRDARVGIIYQPSYAITAVALYCYDRYRAEFSDTLKTFLSRLLGIFEHGIIGHGFDAAETVRKTMSMLSTDSVKRFLDEDSVCGEHLHSAMEHYLKHFEELLANGAKITEGFDLDTPHNLDWQQIVGFWHGYSEAVFVYGTLRKGERANYMLENSVYCGKYYLKDCAMYDLGSYPGIKENAGEYVVGEVYLTDSTTMKQLDRYEGEGSLYDRKMVTACNGCETVSCYAYFYRGEVDAYSRMLKPWGAQNDMVWYAAYGSNLSEDRFSCYIKGGVCRQNGKYYRGCSDKSNWEATELRMFKGRLYFGNQSGSWGGKGVAFYDENGHSHVQMKLYKITREQLFGVRSQEGSSDSWYGRLVCLGIDENGTEIYTLTSKGLRPENAPSNEYIGLLEESLKTECGYTRSRIKNYFGSMDDDGLSENDVD